MHGKIEITDRNMEEWLKEISGDDDIESTKRSFTDKKDLLIDLEQLQEANRWMIIETRLVKACRFFERCYNNIE